MAKEVLHVQWNLYIKTILETNKICSLYTGDLYVQALLHSKYISGALQTVVSISRWSLYIQVVFRAGLTVRGKPRMQLVKSISLFPFFALLRWVKTEMTTINAAQFLYTIYCNVPPLTHIHSKPAGPVWHNVENFRAQLFSFKSNCEPATTQRII